MVEDIIQTTILNGDVVLSGPTLFTGFSSKIRIITSEEFDGVYFRRLDLPCSGLIKATLENVYKTPRTTIIGNGEASVVLIEHLMATLYAFGIKKCLVEVEGPEVPIGDGSAIHFVDAILNVGVRKQTKRLFTSILEEHAYAQDNQEILAKPSRDLAINYKLAYLNEPLLNQQYSFKFCLDKFIEDIAPCRTFALKTDVDYMVHTQHLKGNSLDYGVVVHDSKVLNPGGLRFEDEMARHKILDFLGDFALSGLDLGMEVFSVRAGHQINVSFAKELKRKLKGKLNES